MQQPIWQVLLLLLLASAVVQGVVLVAVMRQVGTILIQIRPPRPGTLDSGPVVGTFLEFPGGEVERPTVVLFTTPNCAPCQELMPSVPIAARGYRALDFVMVITGRDEEERRTYAPSLDGVAVRPDLHFLHDKWEIPGTPYAVGLDTDGRVLQAGVVNHLDHLEALAEAVLHGHEHGSESLAAPNMNGDHSTPELATASSTLPMEGIDA
jgi:thiol-disulfide isomerase/thioredoxin